MALVASDILNTVSQVALDESNVRWSSANLLKYLNEAQRQIVSIVPEAGTRTVIAQLDSTTGVLQTLPAGGRSIVDMPRNVTVCAGRLIFNDTIFAPDGGRVTWSVGNTSIEVDNAFGSADIFVTPAGLSADPAIIYIEYSLGTDGSINFIMTDADDNLLANSGQSSLAGVSTTLAVPVTYDYATGNVTQISITGVDYNSVSITDIYYLCA